MILNGENLLVTQIGFRTEFYRAFEAAPTEYERYSMIVPSTKRTEQYKWLGALPLMREWLDDAEFEQLMAFTWEIVNRTWMTGLEIDREDIEDDSLGLILPSIAMMGAEAKRHPGVLVMNLMNTGFTTKCYDGQNFFSTTHQDGVGLPVQSNAGTAALAAASYQTARSNFRRLTDQKKRPLSLLPKTLIVPPELETTAKNIVAVERLANGASNPNYGTADIIVSPFLTSATAWFLADLDKPLKPFVTQFRRMPEFLAQDQPTNENAFLRKKFRYQANARYNAGYGLWHFIYGSTGLT